MKLKEAVHWFSAVRKPGLAHLLIVALLASALAGWLRPGLPTPTGSGPVAAASATSDASLAFEANQGQTDAQVRYLARGDQYTVYLTDNEAVLAYRAPSTGARPANVDGVALRFGVVGGQMGHPVAEQPLVARTNYFIGNDSSRWLHDVASYGRVVYQNVYPGIDLAYYGHQGALEYDLVVAPGADPRSIRLSINGADALRLDGQDLLLATPLGTLRAQAPAVYQDGPQGREAVAGSYTLLSAHEVGFTLGTYDASRPVVIDPIIWSSFIGGDSDPTRPPHGGDWGIDLATDAAGNVLMAGTTDSLNYPTTAGAYQTVLHNFYGTVVSKISSDGLTLLWSTFIGGTEDYPLDRRDHAHGIALDGLGNVWVTGFTDSATYPTTAGVYQPGKNGIHDTVISELSPTGNALLYSTFLGGAGDDWGYSIAIDPANKVYVLGATEGAGFPTTPGVVQPSPGGQNDAFVVKIDPTLAGAAQLVYSTYLGGSGDDMLALELLYTQNPDDAYYREGGIKVDAAGNAYVSGYAGPAAAGPGFPTTASGFQTTFAGTHDAFLTKLNPTATALLYSTLFGTTGDTHATVLTLDSLGNAIIAGRTQGIPTTAGAFQTTFGGATDAFVAKFNTALSGAASLLFSTYLGGAGDDGALGVAANTSNYIFVSGTASAGFPTTAGSPQPANQGGFDTFLAQLNPTGATLSFSSFWGGQQNDWASGLALDGADCAYVTGATLPGALPPNPQPRSVWTFPITPPNVFQPDPGDPTVPGGGGKMEGIIYKMCAPPTAAQVSNMAAAPARAGGVDVQWTSASELDHLGFNVLRAASASGPFQAVNAALIRPDPAGNGGGTYRFHDASGTVQSWYRIEAVDTHNSLRRFTPFAVGKTLPVLPAAPSAADQAAEGANLAAANAKALAAQPHGPLTTTAYKLLVSRSGLTRVTYAQLQAAGVPLAGVDPARLRLTTISKVGNVHNEVPLALHLATPGVFAPGDSFDFIAAAAPSQAGDARAYYLDVAPGPAARMATGGSAQTRPPYALSFPSTLHLEQNLIYWQQAPAMGAPQPEGPWYWAGALDIYDGVVTLQVPDVATGPAALTLHVQGFTSDAAQVIDHHLQASLNGILLGDWRWSGRDPQQQTVTIPAGVLHTGDNELRLHTVGDTGVAHDGVYLASADVAYTRYFHADGDSLALTVPGGSDIAIHRLSSGAVLYDVTAAGAPVALASRQSGNTLFAHIPGSGPRQLLVAAPAGMVAAGSIAPVVGDNLHSGGAEYVVITADSLLAAGQQLAALHAAQGLTTRVVPVSAIYDQFGSGAPDPAAIAAFLTWSSRSASPAARYAVLLGSASFDAHGYLNGANPDLLPTNYFTSAYTGRTPSDSSLALPAGSRQPIIALGRLPARSPAEAAALVAKLQAYQTTTHAWSTEIGLVADAGDSGDFNRASETLSRIIGIRNTERIYESQYGSGTAAQILANLNSGRALLNFYGHGSLDQWGTGNIFNTTLVNQVNNAGRETFLTAITCFNGDYSWGPTSLVTAMVLKPTGGAIGAISGTAISNPSGQHPLNEAFYRAALAGKPVGDALQAGYAATADAEVVLQFQLIGDPAMRLDVSH
jgi:hypothetical protein